MNFADLSEIKAGMLLNLLYPELMDEWVVRYAGTFYRNYSDDALQIDAQARKVTLSRDGFLKLLPPGFLSEENELREGSFDARYARMRERVALLGEQFAPFDTFAFRRELHLEKAVSEILESQETFILRTWYGIDPDRLSDPLTRELAFLLPYLKHQRGNALFVRDLLESLLGRKVRLTRRFWSETDSNRARIPWLRYEIVRDGMDSETFLRETEVLRPAADFIREWLLPAEARCDIVYTSSVIGEEAPILDYNSTLA